MLCIKTKLKKFNNNYQEKIAQKLRKKIDFKVVELNLKNKKEKPKNKKGQIKWKKERKENEKHTEENRKTE